MRKILCSVLALIIIFSYFTISFAENENNTQNTTSQPNTTDDLYEQQKQIKNQLDNTNQELDIVQEELSENLQQVQKLDEKISNAQKQIEELTAKATELKESIKEVEIKLEEAEKKYSRQEESLEDRLIAIYESGDTQYLDVVLQSKSISDFLSNYFLITEIASYDTELLEDMKEKRDVIDLAKQKLEKNKKI